MVIATPRTRETGSSANFSVTVPLVSDVPKRRTAEGALDPVPVREHFSADSGRVPLVIGFKWDEHGDRLAPVGDDDPLPLGHPLEEMGEVGGAWGQTEFQVNLKLGLTPRRTSVP